MWLGTAQVSAHGEASASRSELAMEDHKYVCFKKIACHTSLIGAVGLMALKPRSQSLPSIRKSFLPWRFPVILPSDISVWEAVPLPPHATHVARNCIYCSVADLGILALSDGDYDGDKLQVTADPEASTFNIACLCVFVSVFHQ